MILWLSRVWREVSTGSVTALIGAPLLLWLLPRLRSISAPVMNGGDNVQPERYHVQWFVLGGVALLLLAMSVALAFGRDAHGWLWAHGDLLEQLLPWRWPRVLSALFAALTSILAKLGMEGINSNLATAIRTAVVLVMAWGIVFLTGKHHGIGDIGGRSWIFLILSGVATGLSWLCYYRALQLGEASRVVPIDKFSVVISMVLAFVVLKEAVTVKTVVGGLLITAGTLVLIL